MKPAECKYCGFKTKVSKHINIKKYVCSGCHPIWQRLRTKYAQYGDGMSVDILVNWFINQPQVCMECGSMEKITIDRIVPEVMGGKYELGNIQLLCYTCNCCKKAGSTSVKEGLNGKATKVCRDCLKELPLTSEYFHKSTFTSKYKINAQASFHPLCRLCRLADLRAKFQPVSNRKHGARIKTFEDKLNYA
jgi:hypothetical protein